MKKLRSKNFWIRSISLCLLVHGALGACKQPPDNQNDTILIDDDMIEGAKLLPGEGGIFLTDILTRIKNNDATNIANDTNPLDKDNTALHYATMVGSSRIIHALIKYKADINKQNREGCSPLHYAVEKNKLSALETLLKEPGIDVNIQDKLGQTPLHYTTKHPSAEDLCSIKMLLKIGNIDVNRKNKAGETPLAVVDRGYLNKSDEKKIKLLKAQGGTS